MKNRWRIIGRSIDYVLRMLTSIGGWIAAICILGMVGYTGLEVFGRYVLGRTTGHAEEISAYMLVAITFMAAAYTFVQKGHISVDVVLNKLSPQGQKVMNIVNGILGVAACGSITWYSSNLVSMSLKAGAKYPISQIPMWMTQLLVPVGMAILGLMILAYTIRRLRLAPGLEKGNSAAPELTDSDSRKGTAD